VTTGPHRDFAVCSANTDDEGLGGGSKSCEKPTGGQGRSEQNLGVMGLGSASSSAAILHRTLGESLPWGSASHL
jgi:hypothetical protein